LCTQWKLLDWSFKWCNTCMIQTCSEKYVR
jgi:hypothetical protein